MILLINAATSAFYRPRTGVTPPRTEIQRQTGVSPDLIPSGHREALFSAELGKQNATPTPSPLATSGSTFAKQLLMHNNPHSNRITEAMTASLAAFSITTAARPNETSTLITAA